MQTKYFTNKVWFFSLVILLAIFAGLLSSCNSQEVPTPTQEVKLENLTVKVQAIPFREDLREKVQYIGGGDCSADRYTGDLYITPDWYCLTIEGKGSAPTPLAVWTKIVRVIRERITPTATSTATATANTPGNPTATITGTPSPKATDGTPAVTATDIPDETATPKPTKTPKPEITGTPEPDPTKTCHVNSGDGNGSEDCDGDGDDDDPGNSGGHNNGGD